MNFQLYKEESNLFRFEDYEILLNCATGKRRALEFGPGYSTYAFLEAGVEEIHSFEYQDKWFGVARDKFQDYPQVEVRSFVNSFPVRVSDVGRGYDIAFVDSPIGQGRDRKVFDGYEKYSRLNTMMFAVAHCPLVLLHDCHRPGEQETLQYFRDRGYSVEIFNTKKGIAVVC